MMYSPTHELNSEEKDLVWKFRHHLTRDKRVCCAAFVILGKTALAYYHSLGIDKVRQVGLVA
jgi:hypothetical protein